MATKELSMKLLIDTKAQKVCFAEADNEVVEFLSSLLCLPMSTVINLLTKERMVGSIGNVLDSLETLDAAYVFSSKGREPYMKPTVAPGMLSPLQQLLGGAQLNASGRFFTCQGKRCCYTSHSCGYVSVVRGRKCPGCSTGMNNDMPHVKAEGFVVGTATYTVKDDLSMIPASSVASVALLTQCGVKDLSMLQEKLVTIGKEEALDILLASLKSKTVLTDVFLQTRKARCKKETVA
ncbi:hypothetical protein D1007_19618 [Hordeum vulgare]|uniref:DUF674 domain-containing protein n=1 Tax=Hordeum vulgare subsp. vulgare TaxID=112509 RepID=A0A8I6YGQ9_HORVV|nr:uncharacterized protein LOC123410019 [Hordeum vulgare subsp. vulgare]KAE8804570.1 hypothetical protein D1007_19618 [Hordeum vulgare]KAI4970126.1 hypothetical protein ZWY2020_001040 [Hordeum vulgare]